MVLTDGNEKPFFHMPGLGEPLGSLVGSIASAIVEAMTVSDRSLPEAI